MSSRRWLPGGRRAGPQRCASTRGPLLAAILLTLAGCYRPVAAPALGEDVRVVVVANDARLVRAQAAVQAAVARTLEHRLGWRVSPAGSARLELALAEEDIDATATDRADIPARWAITLRGGALLRARAGNAHGVWSGTGHASGRDEEPAALERAADDAARQIATWLEDAVPRLGEAGGN